CRAHGLKARTLKARTSEKRNFRERTSKAPSSKEQISRARNFRERTSITRSLTERSIRRTSKAPRWSRRTSSALHLITRMFGGRTRDTRNSRTQWSIVLRRTQNTDARTKMRVLWGPQKLHATGRLRDSKSLKR